MRSKLLLVTIAGITAVACSSGEPAHLEPGATVVDLGSAPTLSASPLTTTSVAKDAVVLVDPSARAAHVVRVEPFQIERTLPLDHTHATGGILVGPDVRYIVGLSGSDIVVHGAHATRVNPVVLPGQRIASVAFDADAGLLALADEFESLALLQLSADGDVEGAWLGGPLLGDDGALGAGGFIGGGRLVSGLSGGRLAVIDVRGSIAAQTWTYRVLNVPNLDRANFIARIPDAERLALVGGTSRLFVLDTDTGAVVSEMAIADAGSRSWSTLGRPHVTVPTTDEAQPLRVIYPDATGKFVEKKLKSRAGAEKAGGVALEQSHLDQARGILTLVAKDRAGKVETRYVARYRLTDSLLLDVSELPRIGDVALAPDHYVVRFPSQLGALERRKYGRIPDLDRLENFNLPRIAR